MPFTFAHPAIVLPLAYMPRQWFSLTGLIIGSLTPDFEYFLRMKVQSDYSHTLTGVFLFDLPLGVILGFIFHLVVRDSLFDNLPTVLKSRLHIFKQFDWSKYFKKNWLTVVLSILIGAGSHIFWDSFTHEHGYFVDVIPGLSYTTNLFGNEIANFKILQHSSTLIGALVIVLALLKLPQGKSIDSKFSLKYWSIFTAVAIIIIALRLLSGLDVRLYGHVIVTMISAAVISLIVTSLIIQRVRK